MIDTCPNCGRKLLSHTLLTCGWCGEVIADDEYQEQARRVTAALASEGLLPTSHIQRYDPLGLIQDPWGSPLAPRFGPSPYLGPLAGVPPHAVQADQVEHHDQGQGLQPAEQDAQAVEIREHFGHIEL
jgi:hypothetical protein